MKGSPKPPPTRGKRAPRWAPCATEGARARATAAWAPPTGTVVTFSHFLPRRECYRGYRALAKVMGDPKLDAQLRAVRTAVHACGHSHMDFDATHDGVRYVQRAFGYPHERFGPFAGPLALDRACASCPP